MPWRDLLRGVLFRVTAEAWVETESVGPCRWGWRLRDRAGRVIKGPIGRHLDRGSAFDAAVRFFGDGVSGPVGSGRFGGERAPGVESTSATGPGKPGADRAGGR